MKRYLLITSAVYLFLINVNSQTIKSPDEFLGYELGSRFTFHNRAVDYFRYVADNSPLAEYREYGMTYEGRPLGVCFVSSAENIASLEELRKNNLIETGLLEGSFTGKQIPFIWLAYNVHGNESAGMETAMKTLYTLVSGFYPGVSDWLKTCVIIIDPCQNPDGRDLYTSRFTSTRNLVPNPDGNS
ncbi:MAG: M14 family zinc carboxypeptidase, partial [Bacteroidota bacterium]|nr:M14 family zinc carboxypeptidase [Bacteroidota bacterium]